MVGITRLWPLVTIVLVRYMHSILCIVDPQVVPIKVLDSRVSTEKCPQTVTVLMKVKLTIFVKECIQFAALL